MIMMYQLMVKMGVLYQNYLNIYILNILNFQILNINNIQNDNDYLKIWECPEGYFIKIKNQELYKFKIYSGQDTHFIFKIVIIIFLFHQLKNNLF